MIFESLLVGWELPTSLNRMSLFLEWEIRSFKLPQPLFKMLSNSLLMKKSNNSLMKSWSRSISLFLRVIMKTYLNLFYPQKSQFPNQLLITLFIYFLRLLNKPCELFYVFLGKVIVTWSIKKNSIFSV